MPKLDLTNAKQIKTGGGEVLQLKGPGFSWAKPITPTTFSFLNTIAGQTGYVINERTENRLVFTRSTAVRSHIMFNWNMPTGTRIRFTHTKSGPAALWARTTNDTQGSVSATVIFNASADRSVDMVLNTASYMGFLTSSTEPIGPTTYTISNLIIN